MKHDPVDRSSKLKVHGSLQVAFKVVCVGRQATWLGI